MKNKNLLLDIGNVLYFDIYPEMNFSWLIFKSIPLNLSSSNIKKFLNNKLLCNRKYKNDWGVHLLKMYNTHNSNQMNSFLWETVCLNWNGLQKEIPYAYEFLCKIEKKYNIFIAANQPVEMKGFLEKSRYCRFFNKIYLNSTININKPDKKFFKFIINDIGNEKQFLMIGDRIDNDITPCNNLNIPCILFKFSIENFPLICNMPKIWQFLYIEHYNILLEERYSSVPHNQEQYSSFNEMANKLIDI